MQLAITNNNSLTFSLTVRTPKKQNNPQVNIWAYRYIVELAVVDDGIPLEARVYSWCQNVQSSICDQQLDGHRLSFCVSQACMIQLQQYISSWRCISFLLTRLHMLPNTFESTGWVTWPIWAVMQKHNLNKCCFGIAQMTGCLTKEHLHKTFLLSFEIYL